MPKPKFDRKEVFQGKKPDTSERVPYVSMNGANRVYEDGGLSIPDEEFVDPLEIEIQELRGQLGQLQQQLRSRTNELLVQDGNLIVHDFQFSPTGLIAPDQFSQEAWEQIGLLLFKLEGAIQWLIGDWLVYGVDLQYGELEPIALSIGRDYKTLRNYMVVSRGVELSRRRDNLSFGHHEAVANLDGDDQEASLAYAAEHGLSVANFRKYLRGDREEAVLPTGQERNYKILSTQFERWRVADPSKAKPQDLEQVRFVSDEMRRELEEFDRKWGL